MARIQSAMRGVVFAMACAATSGTQAQLLKYDNEEQLMGAALSSPESTQRILERLAAKCGGLGDPVRTSANDAVKSWAGRHQAYLDESKRVRRELEAVLTAPEARRGLDELFQKQLPAMVERQYQVYAGSIDAAPTPSGKVEMCKSYVDAIVGKKFDLKSNDPALTAFFEKRIKAKAGK